MFHRFNFRKFGVKKLVMVFACIIVLCASLKIGFSYFFTEGSFNGNSLIHIPAFAPKVNSSYDINQSITLTDTITNGKSLAPGAVGRFKIDIDFSDVETLAYYKIYFDRTNIPNNIHFYVDEGLTKEITNIEGVQFTNYQNKNAEHYIYWSWIYNDTSESNQNDNLYMNKEITIPFTAEVSQRGERHGIVINGYERPTGRVNLSGVSGSFNMELDYSKLSGAGNYKVFFTKENSNLHFYSDSECQNEITFIDVNYDGINSTINKTIYWKLDGSQVEDLSTYYIVY